MKSRIDGERKELLMTPIHTVSGMDRARMAATGTGSPASIDYVTVGGSSRICVQKLFFEKVNHLTEHYQGMFPACLMMISIKGFAAKY